MNKEQIVVGVVLEERFSFTEVCHKYNINEELLIEMMEHGIFSSYPSIKEAHLNAKEMQRIESAFRLHRDLEINLAGVALALDLLDELAQLRKELDILNKHF